MKNLLYKKKIDTFNISLTVHECPTYMFYEIYPVFKIDIDEYFKKKNIKNPKKYFLENFKIVCTWQKSKIPINTVSEDISKELDRLYENFMYFINKIKKEINKLGYWIDCSDPHTGKALFGNYTNITYRELYGLSYLLGYDSERMGCCGMVLHPEFKYNGYPITFFTDIKLDKLKNIFDL